MSAVTETSPGGVAAIMNRSGSSSINRASTSSVASNQDSPMLLSPRTIWSSSSSPRKSSRKSLMKGQLFQLKPPLSVSPFALAARRGRTVSLGGSESHSSIALKAGPDIFETATMNARARNAQKVNDAMVYLGGSQIYTCGQCRTHLTSHDDIISKSFHGRHGRAYLFDQCVNVTVGKAEDRRLMTGLHSVCDISCKRCKTQIGWTYKKCYEPRERYKEHKFIIEKMFIHMEDNADHDVIPAPAGERPDRWRRRSMSWGKESPGSPHSPESSMVYEYQYSNPSH